MPRSSNAKRTQALFFEDLKVQLEWIRDRAVRDMTDPSADLIARTDADAFRLLQSKLSTPELADALRRALDEVLVTAYHSMLVTFDGGTQLAEHARIRIVDDKGKKFDEGLHELFIDYLLDAREGAGQS